MIVGRKRFNWTVRIVLACRLLAGFLSLIVNLIPYGSSSPPPPDNYMLALHKALMFFNAQRSGSLPINNNVPWRGNSGMEDGKFSPLSSNNLIGGYYDAGDAVKFNFPVAFAMTMLSWSVIEYSAKYDAHGELGHVKEIIKWGTDYLIKTFDSSSSTINKVAPQVLLSRLRLFLNPGYPYDEILSTYHNQTSSVMCSYLPSSTSFESRGGLIQLNHGKPQPLQYAVNAAFLASVFSDCLKTANMRGWYCGYTFYSTDVLRNFAKSQINYVLGSNPEKISYVVGFGDHYPNHVHHRGASIPKNGIKYTCKGGWKWRDTNNPNPNRIVGAMVAGPDRYDGFDDNRNNYNYTESTLAGSVGLVAALSLCLVRRVDWTTIRYSLLCLLCFLIFLHRQRSGSGNHDDFVGVSGWSQFSEYYLLSRQLIQR